MHPWLKTVRRLSCAFAAVVTLGLPALAHAQVPNLTPEQRAQLGLQTGQGINDVLRNVINADSWLDSMQRHLTNNFLIWEDMAVEATSFEAVANSGPRQRTYTAINVATREATTLTEAQYQAFLAQQEQLLRNAQGGNRNTLVEGAGEENVDLALMRVMLARMQLTQAQIQRRLQDMRDSQIMSGRTFTVAELLSIYEGYDPAAHGVAMSLAFPPGGSAVGHTPEIPWYSPSAAGTSLPIDWLSLSGAGNSLPLDWYLPPSGILVSGNSSSLRPPYSWLLSGNQNAYIGWQLAALAQTNPDLARSLYGPLWSDRPNNPLDNLRSSGGQWVANTSGLSNADYLRLAANGDLSGLSRLLAQPFNILVTWGATVNDLDLHMTGPDGAGGRFHIYYADRGSLTSAPFAQLITDCICTSGSEVILTTNLLQGGVYRVSAFNFGDQSATGTGLSNGNVVIQVVRGGTAQGSGQGTTIVGGTTIFTSTPTPNQPGNTWVAVEIDPATGRIFTVNQMRSSAGSPNVP